MDGEEGNDKVVVNLVEENKQLHIENNTLKADIGYWKSRHRDAVEREAALKKALQDKNARIKYLTRQLYEKKTEGSNKGSESDKEKEVSGVAQTRTTPRPSRHEAKRSKPFAGAR